MSSVRGDSPGESEVADAAEGDLSASARIVRAALSRFAQNGVAGATVRDIAADAGVSAALVIHHFGNKEGLRRECDRRVVAFLQAKKSASAAQALDAAFARYGAYAARMLAEDSPESRRLFDELLAVSATVVADGSAAGSLRPSSDADAQAVALLVLGLAPFLFTANLRHWAGSDAESAMTRLAVPIAEIYTSGLLTDGRVLEAAESARGARA
jgi:AcrR family transcriptional regulator